MNKDKVQRRSRSKFNCAVSIETDKLSFKSVRSRDISLNGIFVETNEKLPVGHECTLTIILDNSINIDIQGKVTRAASDGLGITFISMNIESFGHLKQIVLFNSENPEEILEQEKNRPGFK